MKTPQNPENLHDTADSKKSVPSGWVSPGTPAKPLVSIDQMPDAKLKKGTDAVRANLMGDSRNQ